VIPTWIAVKEHTPVEIETSDGSKEENIETASETLNEDTKNKLVLVRTKDH